MKLCFCLKINAPREQILREITGNTCMQNAVKYVDPNMLSLAQFKMLHWDMYTNISKDNHSDEVKVIRKTGQCHYSLKLVKAIPSHFRIRKTKQEILYFWEALSGVYLTVNNVNQSWSQHLLTDLEEKVFIFIVILTNKLDPDRQRSLNIFLMLPPLHRCFKAKVRGQSDSWLFQLPCYCTARCIRAALMFVLRLVAKPFLILTCGWTCLTYKG